MFLKKIIKNRVGVPKKIVHIVSSRYKMDMGLFKMEGGGCHVKNNTYSGKVKY